MGQSRGVDTGTVWVSRMVLIRVPYGSVLWC